MELGRKTKAQLIDIIEQQESKIKELSATLDEKENYLESIITSCPIPFFYVEKRKDSAEEPIYRHVNPKYLAFLKKSKEELLNKSISQAIFKTTHIFFLHFPLEKQVCKCD